MIATLLLAGCSGGEAPDESDAAATAPAASPSVANEKAGTQPPPIPPDIGANIARAEWAKANNGADCDPLALAQDGDASGTPRRAEFTGGWAVAFDQPDLRSAYGFAGTDVPLDSVPDRAALYRQWPTLIDLGPANSRLPEGSYAGYGLEGAAPLPFDRPGGEGMHNAAYLRVAGQACLYNVWSRISRAHLETLLANLAVIEP